MIYRFTIAALVSAGVASAAAMPAAADDMAEHFKDKTVTVVVPSGSGGTFHIYGQIVARHIGEHIPGKPDAVTQNRPGAGGVKAANYMAAAAPKDGSVIAEINPGSVIVPLMREVHYDPRKFNWLGTVATRTYTLAVWENVEADTIERHKKDSVIMGASGVGSLNYQIPHFMNTVLGTKYQIIKGYKGGGGINLAMERGEVQGRGNFYSGYTGAKPDWIRDGKVKFFATLGPTRPEVKDVPQLGELIEGDVNKQMFRMLEVGFHIGQSFYAPPGVPKAQVDALRTAFDSMMKDPKTTEDAEKRRVPVSYQSYKDVERIVDSAFDVKPEVAEKLAKILGYSK